ARKAEGEGLAGARAPFVVLCSVFGSSSLVGRNARLQFFEPVLHYHHLRSYRRLGRIAATFDHQEAATVVRDIVGAITSRIGEVVTLDQLRRRAGVPRRSRLDPHAHDFACNGEEEQLLAATRPKWMGATGG